MNKKVITALIHNQNGVLTRLMGLFTKHQFQIESLSVVCTKVKGVSKMSVTIKDVDEHKFLQLVKQINKQIDVLYVTDRANQNVVAEELALIKKLL